MCYSESFWSQDTETRSTGLKLKREARALQDIIFSAVELVCRPHSASRLGGSRPAPKHPGQPQKTVPVSSCFQDTSRGGALPSSSDADGPDWVTCSLLVLGMGLAVSHTSP